MAFECFHARYEEVDGKVSQLNEALAKWDGKPADFGWLEAAGSRRRATRRWRVGRVSYRNGPLLLFEGTLQAGGTPSRLHNHQAGFPSRSADASLSGDTAAFEERTL